MNDEERESQDHDDTAGAQRFYRIIPAPTSRLEDFQSDQEAGKPLPRNPEYVRYWRGRSVYSTMEAARGNVAARKARAASRGEAWREQYIAEVTIRPESPINYEQSGRNEEHFTLWGDTRDVFDCVTKVLPGSVGGGGANNGNVLPALE